MGQQVRWMKLSGEVWTNGNKYVEDPIFTFPVFFERAHTDIAGFRDIRMENLGRKEAWHRG